MVHLAPDTDGSDDDDGGPPPLVLPSWRPSGGFESDETAVNIDDTEPPILRDPLSEPRSRQAVAMGMCRGFEKNVGGMFNGELANTQRHRPIDCCARHPA